MNQIAHITKAHIDNAIQYLRKEGADENSIHHNYWVVDRKSGLEFPFKQVVAQADKLARNLKFANFKFHTAHTYVQYIKDLGFTINHYDHSISFFGVKEIEIFERVGGTKYRKENFENIRDSRLIKPLVYKSNAWARFSAIGEFKESKDNHWQWSGTFKPYTWIKIYKPVNRKPKLFFTVGVDSTIPGLIYKLDCLRSNYTQEDVVSPESQERFDRLLVRAKCPIIRIHKHDLHSYDWAKLVQETQQFMNDFEHVYDEAATFIYGNHKQVQQLVPDNSIQDEDPPNENMSSRHQDDLSKFSGKAVDWTGSAKESKRLGDTGEELVRALEVNKLEKAELFELAGKVQILKGDGQGYDVESFDLKGNKICIEVKTTTGDRQTPFYMSYRERLFAEQTKENYYLYRLYNYRYESNSANRYILNQNQIRNRTFKAIHFEVL